MTTNKDFPRFVGYMEKPTIVSVIHTVHAGTKLSSNYNRIYNVLTAYELHPACDFNFVKINRKVKKGILPPICISPSCAALSALASVF